MVISLIIPIYKAEPFLPRLFENLEAQGVFFDDKEFGEVIFVNDGSPDNSEKIILEYSNKHPWVRYIRQENQGQHIARNTGIDAAKGEYIAFMDQDDAYTPDSLSVMLDCARRKEADILRGNFAMLKDLEYYKWQSYSCNNSGEGDSTNGIEYILRKNGLHYDDFVWASLYKKDFLKKNNFRFHPDVSYSEDAAFIWMVFPEAKKVVSLSSIVYIWIQRDDSESHTTSIDHRLKREKNAEKLSVFMFSLLRKFRSRNDVPKQILHMLLLGSYWSCYKYFGTLVKFRGLTKEEIEPTIKRLKEEGVYPYPHKFPRDLPEGYPTSLRYRIMWRLMSYEWILKLMLRLRTRKVPLNLPKQEIKDYI